MKNSSFAIFFYAIKDEIFRIKHLYYCSVYLIYNSCNLIVKYGLIFFIMFIIVYYVIIFIIF